jgi:orotate phosphoribosyltransferase
VLLSYFCIWLHGQEAKTSPLHGGNTGSIPVGVIIIFRLSKEMPVSYRQKIEKESEEK